MLYIYLYIYIYITLQYYVKHRRVRFHRIRDFKQYYFGSIPPTSRFPTVVVAMRIVVLIILRQLLCPLSLGNFASQEFYTFLRSFCKSVAEIYGKLHFRCEMAKWYGSDLPRRWIRAKTMHKNNKFLACEIP